MTESIVAIDSAEYCEKRLLWVIGESGGQIGVCVGVRTPCSRAETPRPREGRTGVPTVVVLLDDEAGCIVKFVSIRPPEDAAEASTVGCDAFSANNFRAGGGILSAADALDDILAIFDTFGAINGDMDAAGVFGCFRLGGGMDVAGGFGFCKLGGGMDVAGVFGCCKLGGGMDAAGIFRFGGGILSAEDTLVGGTDAFGGGVNHGTTFAEKSDGDGGNVGKGGGDGGNATPAAAVVELGGIGANAGILAGGPMCTRSIVETSASTLVSFSGSGSAP